MIVRAVQIKLSIAPAASLKDKRRIVRSIVDRVRHRYNVSIAEIDALDDYNMAVLGLTCVSNSSRHAGEMLDEVIRFIDMGSEAEIISVEQFY